MSAHYVKPVARPLNGEDQGFLWLARPAASVPRLGPGKEEERAAEERVLSAEGIEGLAVNPGIILGAGDVKHNGGRMLLQAHRKQSSPCVKKE